MSKKAKKALAKSASAPLEYVDQSALNRRAQRFQREHEIERNKSMVTFPPNRGAPSLLDRASSSTYSSSAYDDTELAVCISLCLLCLGVLIVQIVSDRSGTVYDSRNFQADVQGLSSPNIRMRVGFLIDIADLTIPCRIQIQHRYAPCRF
jgi:hypothetical protein